MIDSKCLTGFSRHDMRLDDVHLRSVCGVTAHTPLRASPPGFQLVKVLKCSRCGLIYEVREDVE